MASDDDTAHRVRVAIRVLKNSPGHHLPIHDTQQRGNLSPLLYNGLRLAQSIKHLVT